MNCNNQQRAGMNDFGMPSGQMFSGSWQQQPMPGSVYQWGSQMVTDTDCGTPPMMISPMNMNTMQPVQPAQSENFAQNMQNCNFPLGMAYVPMQAWSQPSPLSEGFCRGTIFCELDLPFVMGRCR